MPEYNWRAKNDRPGSARFFDTVTGEEVGHVFFWNSDTGRIGRYQRGADGRLLREPAAPQRLLEVWEIRTLRAEWNNEADTPHIVVG